MANIRKRPVGRPSKAWLEAEAAREARRKKRAKAAKAARNATRLEARAKDPAAQTLGRRGGLAGTPRQTAARRRNALGGGRPGRVCVHCLTPVLGGHKDKRLDITCGQHAWLWRSKAPYSDTADLRAAIKAEISALTVRLRRLDTAEAPPAPWIGAGILPDPEASQMAPPEAPAAVGEAIGAESDTSVGQESEAAIEAIEAPAWRGYSATGYCLDCGNFHTSHKVECPYWTHREDIAQPMAT